MLRPDPLFFYIAKIAIDREVGHFRVCPSCRAVWTDDYLFCPHDGVETVWGEPSGALTRRATGSTEDAEALKANVIEAILNASLVRSGVDPSSPEAEKAKEFGKLWLNPLADPKDIENKLHELRQDFLRKAGSQ